MPIPPDDDQRARSTGLDDRAIPAMAPARNGRVPEICLNVRRQRAHAEKAEKTDGEPWAGEPHALF